MIKFKTVRWKNILSTGNYFTEIQLDRSSNTLVIGSNGAGKSTMLDALCFGLFGKPFRKINKPNLLNSINQANGVVEIEFAIGSKHYKVIRGIKPNLFEIHCNGNMVNQDAKARDYQEHLEKFILKLNFKTFTQVVILGSASFVPFMQLSPADRRTIIEDLLDIQIFTSMNVLVRQKLVDFKESTMKLGYDAKLTAEKIELQKQNIEEHKKSSTDQIEKKRTEIVENEQHVSKLNIDIDLIQKHIEKLQQKIADKSNVEQSSIKYRQLESKLETRLTKIEKEIKFYEENHNCPTCKQDIDETFRSEQIDTKTKTTTEVDVGLKEIKSRIEKANARITEVQKVLKDITEHSSEIVKHNASIIAINKFITKSNKDIEELQNLHGNITTDNSVLKTLKLELSGLLKQQEELSIEKHYYEYVSNMLKDSGIKTKIIKQYLPIMNKLINKYLTALDFFVNFNIDENFQETIKSRHRDDFTYDSFSEGEKLRIDLALLFTWRQVAKMKNSTNTNLLVLDEVFDSSLDTVGTEDFLKLLNDMDKDTNVFIISHKGDQLFDKFRSVIKFVKKNNFSQIEKGVAP